MTCKKVHVFRPHKGPWFKTPLFKAIKNERVAVKYEYIVDNTDVKYLPFFKSWTLSNLFFNLKELILLILWCFFYKKKLTNISFNVEESECVFFFLHGNLSSVNGVVDQDIIEYLSQLKCSKVCHVTHFQYGLEQSIKNVLKVKPSLLIGEGDPRLVNNILAEKWGGVDFKPLPFAVKDQFYRINKVIEERDDNIVLTGTIAPPITDLTFYEHYKTDCLQPQRHYVDKIFDSVDYVNNVISNNYDGSGKGVDNQQNYFKQDILELYSNHKFAIVTSEIVGFPAIGLFEALVSGCIIISSDNKILELYGLKKNVHYIYVDNYNEVKNILDSIEVDDLQRLSYNAKMIADNFSIDKVSKTFWGLCAQH